MNKDSQLIFEAYKKSLNENLEGLLLHKISRGPKSGYRLTYYSKYDDKTYEADVDYNHRVIDIRRRFDNGGYAPLPKNEPEYGVIEKKAALDAVDHWRKEMGE